MIMMMVLNMVLLPMFGGDYNQPFLSAAVFVTVAIGAVGTALVCIGVSEFDKPENFIGTGKKREPLKIRDMWNVLRYNRPLQFFIIYGTSVKIAYQTASKAMFNTMLFGILFGVMGISTILMVIGMIPSILFAMVGAKYAGKHGSKNTIVTWTFVSMIISIVTVVFFVLIEPRNIAHMGPEMIGYVLLTLAQNGSNLCITTANTAFVADIIDYELDRSGKYIPAVVTGTHSLIDKIVSSFGALIATGAVALIGYTSTLPQPTDASTPAIFWMTMAIKYGLPVLGWACTLAAMRFCRLDKAEMVAVQKRIADKKAAARREVIEENL